MKLHDSEETGAEYEELQDLIARANRETARQKRLDKNAIIFSRVVAKYKRERVQGELAI